MIALLAVLFTTDVRATLAVTPAQAQVGEPVVLSLVVEHPSATPVTLPAIEPGVRGSWMFVESLGARREPKRDLPGTVVETATWRAFALEGGAALPALDVEVTVDGAAQKVAAEVTTVDVAHALREGEDAPRPPKGFREPVEWTGGESRLWIAAAFALLAIAGWIGWRVVARRRRRTAAVVPATAVEQLARIAGEPRDDPDANRDLLYAVTRIVRTAVDAHVGELRAARTDAEWLAVVAADGRVPEGVRSASRRLLERAEAVKYAGLQPTRFAVDEALADARSIAEALVPERRAA